MRALILKMFSIVIVVLLSACGGEDDTPQEANATSDNGSQTENALPPEEENSDENGDDSDATAQPVLLSVSDDDVVEEEAYSFFAATSAILPTLDFYIFTNAWYVFEVRMAKTDDGFASSIFLHQFDPEAQGSLAMWVNNQYNDVAMGPAATLVTTTELSSSLVSIAHSEPVDSDFINSIAFQVDYTVSDYADDNVSLEGFSGTAKLHVYEEPNDVSVVEFGSEEMENLEDHLGWWRTSPKDTRDFHIFQDAGLIIEARLSTEEINENILVDIYIHYFDLNPEGSLMAWAQQEVGGEHNDSAATLLNTLQLPSDSASVLEVMPLVKSTVDGWVLNIVPYQVSGYSDGAISFDGFTTTAGVAVVEDEDYLGIPLDEQASIEFGEEGMANIESHFVWFPVLPSDTRDFHIFQDKWVVLEARLSEATVPGEFNIALYAHYFIEEFGGSLSAWVNNQYSDALQTDFAVMAETVKLPDSLASIVSSHDTGYTTIADWPLYEVEYFVDNYEDEYLTFTSFSTTANVAVEPPASFVTLSVDDADRSFETNELFPIYGHYTTTQEFFIFYDESAVVRTRLDNLEGNSTVDTQLQVYLFEPGADIEKWVNNQSSDALFVDPPTPVYSAEISEEALTVTHNIYKGETEFGYGLFTVRYEVEDYANDRFELEAFSSTAEVAVDPEYMDDAPVVGICLHSYEDAVLHIDRATGIQFGTEYSEIILSDFTIDGVAVHASSVIRESSSNVVLSEEGDSLLCTLPCSFGEEPGEWEFNSRVQYDISTKQTVMADYQTFVGGCPSFNDHGTHAELQMEQGVVTIQ